MNRILLLLLPIFPLFAIAEEFVAVLDLKFIDETKQAAAWMCYDEIGDNCHPWAYFYVFEARLKKAIEGEFESKKFKVLFGRHALPKRDIKNLVVTMRKLENESLADYQVLELGSKMQVYCFSGETNKLYNVRDETNQADLNCYEAE